MIKQMEVYKCGKEMIIEVLKGECCCADSCGDSCHDLSCCGEPMKLQKANTVDAAKEKHVPILEAQKCGVLIKVGSVPHPMGKVDVSWKIMGDKLLLHYDAPKGVKVVVKPKGRLAKLELRIGAF